MGQKTTIGNNPSGNDWKTSFDHRSNSEQLDEWCTQHRIGLSLRWFWSWSWPKICQRKVREADRADRFLANFNFKNQSRENTNPCRVEDKSNYLLFERWSKQVFRNFTRDVLSVTQCVESLQKWVCWSWMWLIWSWIVLNKRDHVFPALFLYRSP